MSRCKATTNAGTRCKNEAVEGSDYCHVPSHKPAHEKQSGDAYWKFRSSHGKPKIFKKPKDLWEACASYFQWMEDNPLKEEKVFHSAGNVTKTQVCKMRAMTIRSLCLYLGIARKTWRNYKEREDYVPITTRVEDIIYSQKLEGAAADLLNSNIIARELGLKDKKDLSSEDGTMSPQTLDDFYSELNDGSDSD